MQKYDYFKFSVDDYLKNKHLLPNRPSISTYAQWVNRLVAHIIFLPELTASKINIFSDIKSLSRLESDAIDQGRTFICYNPLLYIFLSSLKYPVRSLYENISKEFIWVEGILFVQYYAKGFIKGRIDFNNNYKVSRDILFNSNTYMESLKEKFKLWYRKVVEKHSFEFTDAEFGNVIEDAGYFNALIWEVLNLKHLYPNLFTWINEIKSEYWSQFLITDNSQQEDNKAFIDTHKKTDYTSFNELFKDPKEADYLINLLHLVQPPVIDSEGNWIGKRGSKSGFAAWIEVLELKSKIYHLRDRKHLVKLANAKFFNLNLGTDAYVFRTHTDLYESYRFEFLGLISGK